MDVEKLIEQYRQAADEWEKRHPVTDTFDLRVQDALRDAATALSTLQAENERLRKELEYEREHANAYHEECGQWEAENEKLRAEVESLKKEHCAGCSVPVVEAERLRDLNEAPNLRAELEQVKRERDAAIKVIERVRSCKDCGYYTGEWTPPCKECQNNEEHHPYFKWRGQKKD